MSLSRMKLNSNKVGMGDGHWMGEITFREERGRGGRGVAMEMCRELHRSVGGGRRHVFFGSGLWYS